MRIVLRPTELGGRSLRLASGYVADLALLDGRKLRARVTWLGADHLDPGQESDATLEQLGSTRAGLVVGSTFRLLEGPREVAAGYVTDAPSTITKDLPDGWNEEVPAPISGAIEINAGSVDGLVLHDVTVPIMSVIGATVEHASFTRVRVLRGHFGGLEGAAIFRRTSFDECSLGVGILNARFEHCLFRSTGLPAYLSGAEFVDCRFEGDFERLIFSGRTVLSQVHSRISNEFQGNDFRLARLPRVAFISIDLEAQVWPDDSHFARILVSREALPEANDGHLGSRREAMPWYGDYCRWLVDFYGNQRELAVWVDPSTLIGRFWELLRSH